MMQLPCCLSGGQAAGCPFGVDVVQKMEEAKALFAE